MTYYYAVNGQQTGPVEEEQLRGMVTSGALPADTLIWREGMPQWQPFSTALGDPTAVGATVACNVCHQTFPIDQTIRYGTVNVCAGCKPRFVQGLREGATTGGALDLATIGSRFGAKILDNIIMYAVQFGIGFIVGAAAGNDPTMTILATVLNVFVGLGYTIAFLGWRGQTLGKMATKIKVVNPDGSDISWGKAFGRCFAEILSGCTLSIGYIIAFWDAEKRTLHDRLAGTRVISIDS
jgi:uncharacterized RDD family membrane protein YckC